MARNRILYQSEGVFISQFANSTNVEEHAQLSRIQLANYSFSIQRQDVNQYGQLGRIGVVNALEPVITFDTSYLLTDGYNERAIGLSVSSTGGQYNLLNHLLMDNDGVNIYIVTSPEGTDLNYQTGLYNYIAIGNAFLDSYSLSLNVGSLPTVSATFTASNILGSTMTGVNLVTNPSYNASGIFDGNTATLPAGSPLTGAGTISALKNGDLSISITPVTGQTISYLDTNTGIHLQSFEFTTNLGVENLLEIGKGIPYGKSMTAPVIATASMNAILSEIQAINLRDAIQSSEYFDIELECSSNSIPLFRLNFTKAKIEQENFASSISSTSKTVDLVFSTQMGQNIYASGVGASGVYDYEAFMINYQELLSLDGELLLVTS